MSWRQTIDALKRDAFTNTIEDPTPTPEARAVIEDALRAPTADAQMAQIRTAARQGLDVGFGVGATCSAHGWKISLSRMRRPSGYIWHLVASRRTFVNVAQDLKKLGQIVAHLGGPRDALVIPEDPTQVHHWRWPEIAS